MDFFESFKELLFALFSDIKITYIIDIAIITFVFYSFIKLIKETRAVQIINGIIVILVISKISELLRLYAINYILQNTLTIGLIAIVIIFQPELRKALEKVGNTRWIIKTSKKAGLESEHIIDEIVDAATTMSRKKIGALMVIVGKLSLNDIIETGTVVDASITSELVQNVFFPKSPLHDGAMLIKNERIVAAGCVLPLSSNLDISKELGTRHRAAIGISETSDALVIIVSEETGAISIAIDGRLQRFLDPASLRDAISISHTREDEEEER